MLNNTVRAMIRQTARKWLKDTCDIDREVKSQGSMGEPVYTWGNVASSVPCRVIQSGEQNRGAEGQVGNRETIQQIYRLSVPYGTPLSVDYRVLINGLYFDVVQLETELTDEVFHHAIIVRRI